MQALARHPHLFQRALGHVSCLSLRQFRFANASVGAACWNLRYVLTCLYSGFSQMMYGRLYLNINLFKELARCFKRNIVLILRRKMER